MTEQQYLEDVIDDQIRWYSEESGINQRKFKTTQVIKISLALAIPIITLWSNWSAAKYIIGVLGALIAFIESYVKIYDFKELWTTYRLTAETLKHQKSLFLTKTEPYDVDGAFNLFVKNTQEVMASENIKWIETKAKQEG